MSDQYLRLSYSDDGGSTWGNWDFASIGEIGDYCRTVAFTRLGSSYQRVLKLRVSSPRKRDILGAAAVIKGTIG